MTAIEFYEGPLTLAAYIVGWAVAMLTGIMYKAAT